jgi:hypothetical protein
VANDRIRERKLPEWLKAREAVNLPQTKQVIYDCYRFGSRLFRQGARVQ